MMNVASVQSPVYAYSRFEVGSVVLGIREVMDKGGVALSANAETLATYGNFNCSL